MLLLAIALSSVLPAQDDAPARRSVERSLSFLEKQGTAWIRERGCLSCHHVPFMLWTFREAQDHGIAVDPRKLAEWTEWSRKESLAQHVRIKLTDEALEALHGDGVAAETVARLAPLAKHPGGFTDESFKSNLSKTLTPEEIERYRMEMAARVPREKGDGGGLDTMGFLLLSGGYGAAEPDFLAATRGRMMELQQADGSWKPGGQLFSMKRSAAEATEVTTMWAMIALGDPNPKALAFVRKAATGKTTEWLAARMIVEKRFGDAGPLVGELRSRQNPDGGWAWLAGGASDPFTTGVVLYALAIVGAAEPEAVAKARRFLVSTQAEDGSWAIDGLTAKPKASKEPIYRYWGTAWAAIGLARTLPEKP
jgi:hypothetical protein